MICVEQKSCFVTGLIRHFLDDDTRLSEEDKTALVGNAYSRLRKYNGDTRWRMFRCNRRKKTGEFTQRTGTHLFPGLPDGPLNFVVFRNAERNRSSWFYDLIKDAKNSPLNAVISARCVVSSNVETGEKLVKRGKIFFIPYSFAALKNRIHE
jgi:hypothetical protein